jgi:hypothetical protein
MLKRILWWVPLVLGLLLPVAAIAQNASLVVTFDDGSSNALASGTYTASFVQGALSPNVGSGANTATLTGSLNSSGQTGSLAVGYTDVLGGGARWLFKGCSASGQYCVTALENVPTGTSSLTIAGTGAIPSAVVGNGVGTLLFSTGASSNVTASLQAPTFFATAALGTVPWQVFAAPGQTADLLDFYNSSGVKISGFTASGATNQVQPSIAVGATLSPTCTQSGSVILIGATTGEVVTLPAPTVGCWFDFVITVSNTSASNEIETASNANFLLGSAEHSASGIAPLNFWANGTSTQAIKMNGSTTGGLIGSMFHIVGISATQWEIGGTNECTATCTTAFTASP